MLSIFKNLIPSYYKNSNEENSSKKDELVPPLPIPKNKNGNSLSLNSIHIKEAAASTRMQKLSEMASIALDESYEWSERKKELSRLGQEILFMEKYEMDVNWRQFSHMHNSLLIPNTSLEGGLLRSSIRAWIAFFNKWKNKGNLFFSVNLHPQSIEKICTELYDLKDFSHIIDDFGLDDIHDEMSSLKELTHIFHNRNLESLKEDDIKKIVNEIRKKLHKKLKKDGIAYLPLGYRHGVTNQGHEIIVKIEQKEDSVYVAILNLGDGCDLNPLLDMTASQEKFSYRYFPIRISNKIFWGEMGQAGFCHLIRYQTYPPSPHCAPYKGSDIYDVFLTLGKPLLDLGQNCERYKAKSQQRSGTCPEKGVALMIFDMLLEDRFHLSPLEIKKIFLNIRFFSLINGFHSYVKKPDPIQREQLRNACETFGRKIDKLRDELHEMEILGATAVIHEILKKTKRIPELKPDNIKNFYVEEKRIEIDPALMKLSKASHTEPKENIEKKKRTMFAAALKSPVPFTSNFLGSLQEWIDLIKSTECSEKRFELLIDCVKMMPLPVWGEKYLNIKLDEINPIVQKIEELLKTVLIDIKIGSTATFFYADQFLLIHSLYMITDALIRQKVVELHQFSSPYYLTEMDLDQNEFTSLPIGEDNHTCKKIQDYFAASKKAGEKGVIFPIDYPVLAVEKFNQDAMHGKQERKASGISHIRFLSQFLHKKLRNAADIHLTEYYLALWQNPKNCDFKSNKVHKLIQMPEEIHTLYYFAFLSFSLLNNSNCPFPLTLSFVRKTDRFGKKGLKIKNKNIFKNHPAVVRMKGNPSFFQEMSINTHFIPINDKSYQKLSTNEAVTARLGKDKISRWGLSESRYRELLRIVREKNLMVHLALEWALTHLSALDHPGCQQIIDHCLFSPGILANRLQEAPSIKNSLRAFIKTGLQFYRYNLHHLSAILFLIRTGICIETHITTVFDKEWESKFVLVEYKDILTNLLNSLDKRSSKTSLIILHLILCELQRKPDSIEELKALYTWIIQTNSQAIPSNTYPWLIKKIQQLTREFAYFIAPRLTNDQQFRNDLCDALFHQLIPELKNKEKRIENDWVGNFPYFSCYDYTINFFEGDFLHSQQGKLGEMENFSFNKQKDDYLRLHYPNKQFWEFMDEEGNQEFTHINGLLKIIKNKNKMPVIWEKKTIGSEEIWCEIIEFFKSQDCSKLDLDFLNHSEKLSWIHFAPVGRGDGKSSFILTYEWKKNIPMMKIEEKNESTVIKLLNEKGDILPIELVNLRKIKDDLTHPLYKAALRISKPQNVLCFFNIELGLVEELNFYILQLQFKRGPKGLESIQFPEYIYYPDQTVEELNHFNGALVLKKGKKTKVILYPYQLYKSREDFSKNCSYNLDAYYGNSSHSYLVFDLNPHDGRLISAKPSGNLYLALLLKKQLDFEKAFAYLARVNIKSELTSFDLSILHQFSLDEERSPSSLAFNLKLLCLIIENLNQLKESRFGKEFDASYHSIFEWGKETYIHYLKTINHEFYSAIPMHLRLNMEEEKAILLTLEYYEKQLRKKANKINFQKDSQTVLPLILDKRFEVLATRGDSALFSIDPKEVSLSPPIFSTSPFLKEGINFTSIQLCGDTFPFCHKEMKNKYLEEDLLQYEAFPNRLTQEAITANFEDLYEKGRMCPHNQGHPFDFILLACLKRSRGLGHDLLIQLLFFTRHFSDQFQDLTFLAAKNEKEKISIFHQICHRMDKIAKTQRYQDFCATHLYARKEFPYTKDITLSAFKKPPPKPLQDKHKIKFVENLQLLCEMFFIKKEKNLEIEELPPFLDPILMKEMGPLENEMLERILSGYEILKTKKIVSYELRKETLPDKNQIIQRRESLNDLLICQRKSIIEKLNASYKLVNGKLTRQKTNEVLSYLRAQDCQQVEFLIPENIMKEVILKNDLSYLSKHSPLLTQEEMEEIIDAVKDYYHQLVLYKNLEQAISIFEKLEKNPNDEESTQALAEILDYPFDYDPHEYPEISYFKVMGGKLPRPEQLSIYKWICEGFEKGENRTFQLAAGGGKTSYLVPLIMQRAKRMNLTPVVCTTQTIYNIDMENLKDTLNPLHEKLGLLEVGMHMKLMEEDLRFIYKELERFHVEGRGIMMTPQAYYALHLLYRVAAIKEKNPDKVKWLSRILHFFKTKSLLLMDEFHRNGDPLTRAIFGTGEFYFIPQKEKELFVAMMLPLLGINEIYTNDADKTPLSVLSRMRSNLLGIPTEEDIQTIREELAAYIVKLPLLKIPTEYKKEFIHYWTVKNQKPPLIMEKWHGGTDEEKEMAALSALAGNFLQDILKHIMKMRTGLDHGISIYPEEKFDTPHHHKSPTTAQFENPYIAIALSIKGTFHRGLASEDVIDLLTKLISNPTSVLSHKFTQWMARAPGKLKDLHIVDINLNDYDQRKLLIHYLSKNPDTIKVYLEKEILPQIGVAKEQFIVTPGHIMNGKHLSFTATPLPKEACSRTIHAHHYENAFAAHVVNEYSKLKNQNYIYPEGTETFFEEIENHQAFKNAAVFLDPGGFFSDWKNLEVAKKWLESSKDLDGVLFFKEGKSLQVNKEEKLSLLLRNGKILEFEGSLIIEALADQKLDWHQLHLGTFYSAAQTESSNVLQKKGTQAFIFVGNLLTHSHLTQTLMRLRGFLSEEMNQTITWIIQKDLAGKIKCGASGKHVGASLFFWTLKNDADRFIKQIILEAFQDITIAVESIALQEIEAALDDPEEQIRLSLKYEEGFLEKPLHDPYALFGKAVQEINTEEVLLKYAQDLYCKLNYAAPFDQQKELLQALKIIIAETKSKVSTIATNYEKTVGKEIEQHCKLKKETEQEELRPRPFDPLAASRIDGSLKITDPDYPQSSARISVRSIMQCPALTKHLYFDLAQVQTATNIGNDLGIEFLKPIDTFTIILEKNSQPYAEVNINEHTSSYIDELKECSYDLKLNHSAFVVSSHGIMIQYGKGSIAPNPEEVDAILKSQWFMDLIIDAKLLRGEIPTEEDQLHRLLARIYQWPKPGFKEFFERVVKAQPNPETINTDTIFEFLDEKLNNGDFSLDYSSHLILQDELSGKEY